MRARGARAARARSRRSSRCTGRARPHEAATERGLVDAVCAGRLARPRTLPSPLRAVLARGLAVDPADRWPTLPALFAALERARRVRRGIAVAAGVLAVAGVGAGV